LRWRKYFVARQYPKVLRTIKIIGIPKPRANLSLMVICLSSSLGASKELVGVAIRIGTVFELPLVVCTGIAVGASVVEEVGAALVEAAARVLVEKVDDAAELEVDAAGARPPDNANTGEKSSVVP
jgi:hypothetical protein